MKIVSVEDIPRPTDIVDTPVDDLVALYKKCQEMQELCKKENGVGLSAVQVGIPWRLFVFNGPDGWEYMVDCEYQSLSGLDDTTIMIEGCLSLRERYEVERFKDVVVIGKKLDDSGPKLALVNIDRKYIGDQFYGRVCQHEIDHHNGILISDIGKVW